MLFAVTVAGYVGVAEVVPVPDVPLETHAEDVPVQLARQSMVAVYCCPTSRPSR
jgi:hypothetical protein